MSTLVPWKLFALIVGIPGALVFVGYAVATYVLPGKPSAASRSLARHLRPSTVAGEEFSRLLGTACEERPSTSWTKATWGTVAWASSGAL